MDRKAIIVISISVVLLAFWPTLMQRLYPPQPLRPGQAALGSNTLAGVQSGGTNAALTAATQTTTPAGSVVSTNTVTAIVHPGALEQTLVVSNALARYTFTSHGGGLKSVELVKFPEVVACNLKGDTGPRRLATLNAKAPIAAMTLLGDPSLQGDGLFTLTATPTGVRAEKRLSGDLIILKEFQIGSNYLIRSTVRLENRSALPFNVPAQEIVTGTATPMGPLDDGSHVGFYWGRDQKVEHVAADWFRNNYMVCIPGTPRTVYQNGDTNVTWSAVHNQFFALVTIPQDPATSVVGRELHLPTPSREELAQTPNANLRPVAFQTGLVYPAVTLAANQSIEHQFSVYAGPKEYSILAKLAADFKFDLDQVMGFDQTLFGSFSGFFAKLLLLAMNSLHRLGIAYGLSIVVITVLIKLLFWPLTQASTRSMKRMQTLQPQLKALQERYKDEPAKLNKKMLEFWKENKVSPVGGCLPMLLQMPVFIGFFAMIQTAIELRGASFLWACDLTQPDTLFVIPLLAWSLPFNLMPLLMGATMLWQSSLQPVSPGMDPAQAKMMKYMPLIFLFMLYSFSSGLTLYWTVQNLLSILQMKLTRAQDVKTNGKSAIVSVSAPSGSRKKL